MSILLALVIGVAVGAGGGFLLLDNIDFLLLNVLCGIVGSLTGSILAYLVRADTSTGSLIYWPSLLAAVIGALIVVLLFDFLHHIMPKRAAKQSSVEEDGVIEEGDDET